MRPVRNNVRMVRPVIMVGAVRSVKSVGTVRNVGMVTMVGIGGGEGTIAGELDTTALIVRVWRTFQCLKH